MQSNPIMIFRLKKILLSSLDKIYNFFVVILFGNKSHYKNACLRPFLHFPGSSTKLTNPIVIKDFGSLNLPSYQNSIQW